MTGKSTANNGNVTLPITRTGTGQPIVFFNGGGATQASWKKVAAQLKGHYETVTFDFRAHGKASVADDYSFGAFLGDAEAVMQAAHVHKPIIVGWSLGADLALAYAAAHPGEIGGLVLVDGAVPLAEPLVENEADLRKALNSPVMKFSKFLIRFTPYGYRLSGDTYADITLELDKRRQADLLGTYEAVDCPVSMVLATKSAGTQGAHAERNNKLWHEGAERLQAAQPSVAVSWVEGTHSLPFKHPAEVAGATDELARRAGLAS